MGTHPRTLFSFFQGEFWIDLTIAQYQSRTSISLNDTSKAYLFRWGIDGNEEFVAEPWMGQLSITVDDGRQPNYPSCTRWYRQLIINDAICSLEKQVICQKDLRRGKLNQVFLD